jgi:hypothetical protein
MKPLVAMTISFLLGATLATYFPVKREVMPKVYAPSVHRK